MHHVGARSGTRLDLHEAQSHSEKAASLIVDHGEVLACRWAGFVKFPIQVQGLPEGERLQFVYSSQELFRKRTTDIFGGNGGREEKGERQRTYQGKLSCTLGASAVRGLGLLLHRDMSHC